MSERYGAMKSPPSSSTVAKALQAASWTRLLPSRTRTRSCKFHFGHSIIQNINIELTPFSVGSKYSSRASSTTQEQYRESVQQVIDLKPMEYTKVPDRFFISLTEQEVSCRLAYSEGMESIHEDVELCRSCSLQPLRQERGYQIPSPINECYVVL